MRVTRYSDIGLRILMYLVHAQGRPTPVTAAEIATQYDVPLNHLVKVAGQLARNGWINATRGRLGGLSLRAIPSALRVGAVLRELEGDAELIDCESLGCQLRGNCVLRSALAVGMSAFYHAMDAYTLADIAQGSTGEQIVAMHRNFMRVSAH